MADDDLNTDQGLSDSGSSVLRRFGDFARSEFPRLLRPELESTLDTIIADSLTSEIVIRLSHTALQRVLALFESRESDSRLDECRDPPDGGADSTQEQQVLDGFLQNAATNPLDVAFDVDQWLLDFGVWDPEDAGLDRAAELNNIG